MRYCGGGFWENLWALLAVAFGLGVFLTFICSFRLIIFIAAILLIGCGITASRHH